MARFLGSLDDHSLCSVELPIGDIRAGLKEIRQACHGSAANFIACKTRCNTRRCRCRTRRDLMMQ
jgi:hypothetical protein